jgi:hypothetical protein
VISWKQAETIAGFSSQKTAKTCENHWRSLKIPTVLILRTLKKIYSSRDTIPLTTNELSDVLLSNRKAHLQN